MHEKDRERRNNAGTSRPGAHSSLGIVDRRRRAEERKNNIRSLNPDHEAPGRGSGKSEEREAKRTAKISNDHAHSSDSVGAHASTTAADRARRKEERQTKRVHDNSMRKEDEATKHHNETVKTAPLDESYQVEATAVNDDEADERVRKLEEQMAAMIQGASPAVAVVNDNSEDEESDDEYEDMPFFQRYRCWIVIIILAIGGGVAGTLLSTQGSESSSTAVSQSPDLAPVIAPTQAPVLAPTQFPLDAAARRDLLETLLNGLVTRIEPAALDWLSDVDTWQPASGSATESQQWIERYAMVVFYNATNGDNWRGNNAGWLDTSKSVCDGWSGINRCRDDRLVANMNFPSFPMGGSLPSEIGLLTELTGFIATSTELVGSIPTEIGQMTLLQRLLLDNNRLVGSIPTEIGQLIQLQELALDKNSQLSGTIPTEVGLLRSIWDLGLYETNISGSIPSEIGQATSLEYLILHTTGLVGTLPTEIGNLIHLQVFAPRATNLSGPIPREIGRLASLVAFDIDDCALTGEIPPDIVNLSLLEDLYLDGNKLSGVVPPLPSSLIECELQGNCFSDVTNAVQPCSVEPNCP